MEAFLTAITKWLLDLAKSVFKAVWDFFQDAFIQLLDLFLIGLSSVINAALLPLDFSQYSFARIFQGAPPEVLFFVGVCRTPEAVALIASALAAMLVLRIITLFQY